LLLAGSARKNDALPFDVRELLADEEIAAAFPLMRELRDRLREAKLGFHFHNSIPCWAEIADLLKRP